MKLGLVVEGHGEITALPVLLRRLAAEIRIGLALEIPNPIRLPKGKMQRPAELERAIELIARKTAPDGVIMVLVDADDDCPATLGPQLLAVAQRARADRAVRVVVANREYESWLIAGAVGLRGYRGLATNLAPPENPEEIRNAKGWLNTRMQNGYSETTDQSRLSSLFALEGARSTESFSKLWRDFLWLVETANGA